MQISWTAMHARKCRMTPLPWQEQPKRSDGSASQKRVPRPKRLSLAEAAIVQSQEKLHTKLHLLGCADDPILPPAPAVQLHLRNNAVTQLCAHLQAIMSSISASRNVPLKLCTLPVWHTVKPLQATW